jgi:hypothetical protein
VRFDQAMCAVRTLADILTRRVRAAQIAAVAATLRRASVATRASAERSQRFRSELSQLQHTARLLPAPTSAGASAAYVFDVSFPGLRTTPAETQVLVGPSDTVRSGRPVCVRRQRLRVRARHIMQS